MIRNFSRPIALFACVAACGQGVKLTQTDKTVGVEINGKLFTEYHFTNCRRPYLYPIIGPTGAAMTRHWPLEDDIAAEERDHPHHKGLWYGHRKVSGVGFWPAV